MRKLLTIIATMIICNAYGSAVYWYVDDSISSISGCEYNGNITKPSPNPQKDGYRFMGWKLDTGHLNMSSNASKYSPTGSYGGTQWTATFSLFGQVVGTIRCSVDTGSYVNNIPTTSSNPSTSGNDADKKNCWCRITSIAGKDVSNTPFLPWTFRAIRRNNSECNKECSYYCAMAVAGDSVFRETIFGMR